MKRLNNLATWSLAAIMLSACSQRSSTPAPVAETLDPEVEVGPYTVTALASDIYHIQDYNHENPAGETFNEQGEKTHFNNCSDLYLLRGSDKALLIDLSNRITWAENADESLRQLVAERCQGKPLIITFTHNHGDHTGMLPAFEGDTTVLFMLPRQDFEALTDKFPAGLRYEMYDEGYLFDLGGLEVNTVLVPGHTHGSIVFDVKGRNMLMTGDAIGSGHGVWIFNAEGFDEYTASVPRLLAYVDNPDNGIDTTQLRIYGGHYWQKDWLELAEGEELGYAYLRDMNTLVDQIHAGTAAHEPSNLNFGALDTYFRLNNSIVVWNLEQSEALRKE